MAGLETLVVWLSVGCSGLLLNSQLVVYAGHCGETIEYIVLPDGNRVKPERCEVHPKSRSGSIHDLAYCRVDAQMGDPVPITPDSRERSARDDLFGVGFGDTIFPGRRARIYPLVHRGLSPYGSNEAEARGAAFCQGDSGGPIFDRWGRLVGVVAAALDHCDWVRVEPRTVFYVAVDDLLPWLASTSGCSVQQRADSRIVVCE